MNSKCDTCAFNKPGTNGAASEVTNRLKGLIAAHGLIPFFCHHSKSGAEYDWQSKNTLGPMSLPPCERKICGGWQDKVAKLAKAGKFRFESVTPEDGVALRRYQRSIANDALNEMEALINAPQDVKTLHKGRLEDLVRAVFGKS